jgi:hypothetical protein
MDIIAKMLFLLVYLVGFAVSVLASGSGTSAGITLKFNPSVRSEAMGEACTAISNDEVSAARGNPSGLFNDYNQEVSLIYNRGIVDDAFGCLNYSQTLGEDFSLGGSLVYFDAGRFDLTTLDGDTTQVSAQRDFLGVATGAYQLKMFEREFLLGANVKFIHSTLLESESAFGMALDLGAMYELREVAEWLFVGLAVRNLGTPMAYIETADPMPLNIQAGASYQLLKIPQHELLVAADAHLDLEDHIQGNLGAEYWFDKMVAIRAGYKVGYDLDSLTAGAGFRYMNFQLDYSFALMSALNSTHKVSLGYTIAVDEARRKEVLRSKPTPKPTPKATPKPQAEPTPVPSVMAEVLQIESIGGESKTVILSIGKNKRVRKGYRGIIFNKSNVAIAKVRVLEVYSTRCLAKVTETSGEIEKNAKAEILKKK